MSKSRSNVTDDKIEILRKLTFLEGARLDVVEHLAEEAVEKAFQPGEVVLVEGSTGREMYLIIEGTVEVVKGHGAGEMLLGKRDPGAFVGEMALVEERPRFATVRALEPTRLLEFSEYTMRSALAQQPELLYRTLRVLSARLREADLQMIADLRQKNRELAQAYRELQEAQAALVEKERLERELELAREMQQSILPDEFPQLPGFDGKARSRPARKVGGDFYDVILLDKDRVGLVMADVSDKGMPAALFMALTHSLIRAEARRHPSPEQVVRNVNRLLLEMNRSGEFVTVFYGVLDVAHRTLCFVRAGHDRPLVYSPHSGECRFLEGDGMLLGLFDPVRLEEVCLELQPGDVLVLYTDGVTDAQSPDGQFFGKERLQQAVCAAGDKSAPELCDFVFRCVDQFQAGAEQYDDTALLVARVGAAG
jgi:sigma-B regulation protein RsbU (phosphoserine phosphatase)